MNNKSTTNNSELNTSDEFLSKQRLLVISPHADDESFGCAGTISRIKDAGGEVFIMVMTIGDLKMYNGQSDLVSGSTRVKEFDDVANFLQIDDYDIVYTDAETHLRLDAIPQRDLIHIIEKTCPLIAINPACPPLTARFQDFSKSSFFDIEDI